MTSGEGVEAWASTTKTMEEAQLGQSKPGEGLLVEVRLGAPMRHKGALDEGWHHLQHCLFEDL